MIVCKTKKRESNITRNDLTTFLASILENQKVDLITKLKILYRPYICPLDSLLNEINHNQKIGEIGCGTGIFLALVGKFCNPLSLFGLEISDSLVEKAECFINKCNFSFPSEILKYDGHSIPDKISEFDTIFLIDVLHHIKRNKQKEFIRSIASKLKPGAKLILKDIDRNDLFFVIFNKLHDLIISKEIGNEISLEQANFFMQENNLLVKKCFKQRNYVYSHYTICAEKQK